uniref:Sushi domain-containing protein n=1 Tax=Ciona savignyi TaxID=51511 RepID=H2YY60_CIOSA
TQAGAWSSPAPTCQPITCIPQQTPPLNGLVSCTSGNSIGSVCTFVCSPGYTLTGSGSTTCNDDFDGDITGVWSTPPPTCRQNDCSPPHSAPLHGSVSCSDGVQVGSQCEFGCDFGYATVGSSLSSCDALNGSEPAWSHPAPVCIQVTCVPPQAAPTNGQVSCTNANNADSVCTFQCDGGYQMSGSASTTCNDDFDDDVFGIWTNPAPTCSRQQCSPPHTNPSNGSVSCSDGSNLGSQCEFACQLGFTLVGAALSSCAQSNGNPPDWTAPAPICTPVVCTEQRAPMNG